MSEHYVSQAECLVIADDEGACLTTVLGSCVAACLWDPVARVGGMNHFLLPRRQAGGRLSALASGSTAMEALIERCLGAGAGRAMLRARLFGGGRVVPRLGDIGAQNVILAREILQEWGIPLVGEAVGGTRARHVRFWPASGMAEQRLVEESAAERQVRDAGRAAGRG